MTDTMYELPSLEGVKKCIITEDAVLNGAKPTLISADPEPMELPAVENESRSDKPSA